MKNKEVCLRDKIGEFLCEFAANDNRIYVIDSDLAKSTKTLIFKDKYPNRFIQAGIAEASAVSIADGLAAVQYKVSGTTLEFFGISLKTV